MLEKTLLIVNDFSAWLVLQGVEYDFVHYIRLGVLLILLAITLFIVDYLTKKLIVNTLKKTFAKTKNKWDDVLIEKRVFDRLAHLLPAYIVSSFTSFIFVDFPIFIPIVIQLIGVYITVVILLAFISFFNALEFFFSNSKKFKDKPIESYFQLAKLISYFVAGIFILAIVLGKSPVYLFSAFGAMTAIVMLIFKDTILGFIASIQIAANDMLKVGDWLEMSKYGADGNVVKITLNTVKIRNWDNTITTIPTYALVTDSFKNWRGMQETGARRVKRHIYISPKSICFTDDKLLEQFKRFQLIAPYVNEIQKEIETYNQTTHADKNAIVNGRNLTNIGVFRKYATLYLQQHQEINGNMTLMVRQLQPNQFGLPIEIYCFANTTEWVEYESIQSDIMDHLIAACESFGLKVYELNGVTS